MTIAIAANLGKSTYLCADSQISNPDTGEIAYCDDKLVQINDYLGLAVSGTQHQILNTEYAVRLVFDDLQPPESPAEARFHMIGKLYPAIRDFTDHSNAKNSEGSTLLAYAGSLFLIASDFTICPVTASRPLAVGTGAPCAMGFLHGKTPTKRLLEQAVQAACANNAFCGGDVQTLEIQNLW